MDKGKLISSLRKLAEALKNIGVARSHQGLARIAKRPEWAAAGFPPTAPWHTSDLSGMAKFISALQEDRAAATADGSQSLSKMNAAKLALLIERRSTLRLNRRIKKLEYVNRAEHEEARARCHETIKRALMQVPRALRQILADATQPAQVEEVLTSALRTVCNEGFDGGLAAREAGK